MTCRLCFVKTKNRFWSPYSVCCQILTVS